MLNQISLDGMCSDDLALELKAMEIHCEEEEQRDEQSYRQRRGQEHQAKSLEKTWGDAISWHSDPNRIQS